MGEELIGEISQDAQVGSGAVVRGREELIMSCSHCGKLQLNPMGTL